MITDDNSDLKSPSKKRKHVRKLLNFTFHKRYILLILCFLNAVVSYADRTNIAITIIPMAEEYQWSLSTQGLVLSSFFYGYVSTQIISGYLSFRIGGKIVLAISCLLWSIFTILTPLASKNMTTLILCRVFLGLSEGFGFPAIMSLIPVHIPAEEHSSSTGFIVSGCYAGAVLANLISPILIRSEIFGWQYVFYIFGFIGCLWLIPWLSYQAPVLKKFSSMKLEKGKFINEKSKGNSTSIDSFNLDQENTAIFYGEDKDFELLNLSEATDQVHSEAITFRPKESNTPAEHWNVDSKSFFDIPWKKILTSREVWAIILAHFSQGWSYWLTINWLPRYYKDTFHVDIMHVGFFTVVPYIVQGLFGLITGMIADYMINTWHIRKLYVRRFMQCTGMIGCSVFMLLASLSARSILEGMIYIAISSGLYTLTFGGVLVNHLDIAPDYASVVYAVGNTAGQIPGILGVWLTGVILEATGNDWNTVFSLSAGISTAGAIAWYFMVGDQPIIGNLYAT